MYCRNCGKETSEGASFCPYCGAKTAEELPKPQLGQETASQASYISGDGETEELPVYKRKNKAALLVAFVPLIYAVLSAGVILLLNVAAMPNHNYVPVLSESILILWGGM